MKCMWSCKLLFGKYHQQEEVCGFVVIRCVGRPIAVDWALSKDRYEKSIEHSGTSTVATFGPLLLCFVVVVVTSIPLRCGVIEGS